ncbi:STAS domain-containing protein [Streptomyces venezuelae]|uniref:STAS domain-containing protein n=1 Tax=Streptomyces venezuelae TaxID=54571 RepID=UPI0037BD07FA
MTDTALCGQPIGPGDDAARWQAAMTRIPLVRQLTPVVVHGELDIGTANELRPDLLRALAHSQGGLDLDLSALTFCDCSGVNLLLALHQHAREEGKRITISSVLPAVERILDLTCTRALFMPDPNSAAA